MAKKEVKVKSYRTKDGKRVKQFNRRQKVLAGAATVGGLAGIGGLVLAARKKGGINKLVKNAKAKATEEASKPNVVLTVNAKHKNLLDKLSEKQSLTKEETKDLYSATQEIWSGTVGDVPKKIKDSIASAEEIAKNTEYDVFLVDLKLKKPVSGFDKEKSQLARLDAFTSLMDNLESIKVSKRLPSSSYSDAGFYSR